MTVKWNDVYMNWQYLLSGFPISLESLFKFHEVAGDSPPQQYPYEGIGWWPTNEYEKLASALADENVLFGETINRGALCTAFELYNNSTNPEVQAAIWIAGSVWDKTHALPKAWQRETHQLLADMRSIIQNEFPELPPWHNTVRKTLPVSITENMISAELKIGNKLEDLLYLIAIEAAVIKGSWKLVKFVQKQ